MYSCTQKIEIKFSKLFLFNFNLLIPVPLDARNLEIEGFEKEGQMVRDDIKKCNWLLLSGKKKSFEKFVKVNYRIKQLLNKPDIKDYLNVSNDPAEIRLISHDNRDLKEISTWLKRDNPSISIYVERVIEYLTENLIYSTNPKSRVASEVSKSKKSDCGGYHSLLCALLRVNHIPAIIDNGYRIDTGGPHVWAWWYNKENKRWNMVDINDFQKGSKSISPRISFGLGLGISNTPKELLIPSRVKRRVSFIQSFCAYPTYRLIKLQSVFNAQVLIRRNR